MKTLAADLGAIHASALIIEDLAGCATKRCDDGAGPCNINMVVSKFGAVMWYGSEGLPDVVGAGRVSDGFLPPLLGAEPKLS